MAKVPKAPKPGKAKKPSGSSSGDGGNRPLVWLSGLACGVAAAVAPGTAVVVSGLLAPGLLALKFDQAPGRPIARTMLTSGLAGCVQPVLTLWNAGHTVDAALALLTDPLVITVAWAAAAAGWLMTQLAPLAVRAALEAGSLTRAARLRQSRAKIAEAWGLEE